MFKGSNRFIYLFSIVYVVVISGFMLWHRAWFSPDQFFGAGIIGAIFIGKFRLFLADWTPFLTLFFSYEYLHGLIPLINKNVHIFWMINTDKSIFGYVPTVKLQQLLYVPSIIHWYDVVASVLYICHFIAPMVTAYLFWVIDRKIFKQYTTALLVLSFAAFITYIIFPAMPPWMASDKGYLPPLKKVMDTAMVNLGHPLALPTIYQFFRGDEVAAVPSLHAAYPFLIFLFAVKKFKFFGLLVLPYVIGVWFAVIYLGEHYFIDVLLGAIYALVTFIVVVKKDLIFEKASKLPPLFGRVNAYVMDYITGE